MTICRQFLALVPLVLAMIPATLAAQSPDDEVMVSDCSEVYEFKMSGGKPVVKNKIAITYETLRQYGVKIQPAVFYGDNILLDASRCGMSTAQYRSATPENVFFDDSRVCYYNVLLNRRYKVCKATFERTFTDVHYFTRVVLGEEYYVKHKTVTFIIPQELQDYHLIEKNLTNAVNVERTVKGGKQRITYTIDDMPPIKHEEHAPNASSVHPTVFVVGSFKDATDMFAWSRQLSDVDTSIPTMGQILAEINKHAGSEEDKIRNTLAWVQDNVRYVAFEAGVSKHQPDTPAEVVRKRYGDCKGMALLLKTLLVAQGFDARLTDVGTREASCLMSEIPTLAAINHAICTLEWQGKTYYLDATCNHIPLGHIPSNVQGMEVMVEEPNGTPTLRRVPVLPIESNCDSVRIDLALDAANHELAGTVSRWLRGDMKEMYLTLHDSNEAADRGLFVQNALNDKDHANTVTNASWIDKDCRNEWAALSANVIDGHSVEQVGDELFVELDPDNMMMTTTIDTTGRVNDYVLPFPCRQVREVVLAVPAGYQCEQLPETYTCHTDVADMSCSFSQEGGKIIYRKVMSLHQPQVARDYIMTWNAHLKRWYEHSHEQIVIKKV